MKSSSTAGSYFGVIIKVFSKADIESGTALFEASHGFGLWVSAKTRERRISWRSSR